MPIGFTNSGIDARAPKHFRCTVAMSTFNTSADAQGGGCTPNGNFPTTNKYFYSTNLTGGKSTTRATTDALALRRERGLMRWESVVRALNEKSNCEIFDIEIVEANGGVEPLARRPSKLMPCPCGRVFFFVCFSCCYLVPNGRQ
jgi:hypothetical protein